MKKTHILMMPGLGLSSEIFKEYSFAGCQVTLLNWLNPEYNEPLNLYCKRVVEGIEFSNHRIVLIGHSFGGIIVQELSKLFEIHKIILISSIKSERELPGKFVLVKRFHLHHLITKILFERSFWIWGRTHGYDTKELQGLFLNSIKKLDNYYFNWATKSLVTWTNSNPGNHEIIHYHGDRDRTFPVSRILNPKIIEGGDHLMVFKKSALLNRFISAHIEE